MTNLPETMLALIQKHDGFSGRMEGPHIEDAAEYIVLATLPVPVPAAGQVLIKLRAASVNPSDLHFIKGEYGQPRVKGVAAGFEGCGDVVAAGVGAEGLMGKRVAFVAANAGAWAEFVVVDAMTAIPLRPDISDKDGAAQIVNPLTAMAMVDIAAKAGDSFVISAATSQLGKLMIGLAKDKGLNAIALVRRENAIKPLLKMGAAAVVLTTSDSFRADFEAVSHKFKPRVFLDAVCDQTSETVFTLMPNGARWVCYGKLSTEAPVLTQMGQFTFMGKQIEGFWLTNWMRSTPAKDQMQVIGEVQARFADGRWKTDVSARLKLAEVVDGLADALKLPDGKVIILP
ncbi:MAG: zinc-binding dehydrogenase [Rhodobacteraceae bacterium]|nr:zinc-binding dehydrogenase [Paracoccaceae bacterium]